ncbi:MAG: aminoglycoside phosphotransferase family protein [Patescibacteria group bacterium]|nr:aminoglycoside phosphotransferase family protein [Patescibacteria group bacterium]
MKTPFKYSKEIDNNIVQAIEKDLGLSVVSAQRIEVGEVSYAYKIKTTKNNLIAKVFKFDYFVPEKEKLFWIERQLSLHKIPFAKTLKISTKTKLFPYGYMVQEFIEGKNGFDAIIDNTVSFEELFKKLITLLKKVHDISVEGYGAIHQGKGEYKTFYESKLNWYKKLRQRLKGLKDLRPELHDLVLQEVEKLKQYEYLMKPVLLHGDATPHNVMCTLEGNLILIDWDNAGSGAWQSEYAGLTYKGAYMWQYSSEEERNRLIRKAYREVYPEVDFQDPDFLEVVKILQILTAYGSLATHYFQHEDLDLYKKAKQRLLSML